MACCFRASKEDDEIEMEKMLKEEFEAIKENMSAGSYPAMKSLTNATYVRYLERQNEYIQSLYFNLSSEMARLQSYLRQFMHTAPGKRNKLINDIRRKPFKEIGSLALFPTLEQHNTQMGNIRSKELLLIRSLRKQIGSFQQASQSLPRECWLSKEKGNESNITLTKKASTTSKAKNTMICRTLEAEPLSDISCMNKSTESCDTCNTLGESVISGRSSSFKELRDMYQKNIKPLLKY